MHELPLDLRDNSVRVVVLSDAAPDRNGVGTYYADLIEQLRDRVGEAVLLHPSNPLSPAYRYLSAPLPGDKTQRVGVPRPVYLWRSIKRLQPTVLVAPTPGPFGLSGLYFARKLGVPLIVGFHTNYEALATLYWKNLFGRLCQRFLNGCNRLLFRHCAMVLANSPDMLRQAHACGAEKVSLMGTSVPTEFISKPTVSINQTVQRVLFAGRLADEKNLPQVIEAARQHPHLQFTIAGDGPLRSMVEREVLSSPNLDYAGWVSRRQLLDLMDSHDVLLLPSRVEAFGTVALEGMARGRLVIVTESCGIAEWPELSRSLHIVADYETPSQALTRLCAFDSDVRDQMCFRAREQAYNLNNWNVSSWVSRLQGAQSSSASPANNKLG
jgi:glycosyltransferase involved in cell wall biosynthesis